MCFKKLISAFMILCLLFVSCGCSSNEGDINIENTSTSEMTTSMEEISTSEIDIPYEEPIEDYSDFDFVNMHGCNELMGIKDYNFSDLNNAYVFTGEQRQVLSFYNSAVTHYNNANPTEDGANGEIWDSVTYVVAGNNVLTLTAGYYAGGIIEISYRSIVNGMPILLINHDRKGSREFIKCDGWYIPKEFIDWSRSPEPNQDEYDTSQGTEVRDSYRYYIKPELLK